MLISMGDIDAFADVELSGVFVGSFARACVNIGILGGGEIDELVAAAPGEFHSADRFVAVLASLERRFRSFEPIKERIGVEMMRLWYELGPGRSIVRRGVDFLHHQTGSEGYHGVVRGPADRVGSFSLLHIDEDRGEAEVRSSSPFDRAMERGILLGGMQLAGDLVFVDVTNHRDPSRFEIRFR